MHCSGPACARASAARPVPEADALAVVHGMLNSVPYSIWRPLSAQVVNAMDAMGNAVFSDGLSLVFTLTITNQANGKAGLAVAAVRA